jgi:hypothetical protein
MFEDLNKYERKVFSQCGQDGVIQRIFDLVGTTNKYFVGFGERDGIDLSNTANLRINHGWNGLLMDGNAVGPVKKEFITAENIEELFKKYRVPPTLDYITIDMDGNDLWVWMAIKEYSPRVVSIEWNSNFYPKQCCTIKYNPNLSLDCTRYYGASLAALIKVGRQKGYSCVGLVENLDAFFVRNDLVPKDEQNKRAEDFYRDPIWCHNIDFKSREWVEI